jgi:hypothetical protein
VRKESGTPTTSERERESERERARARVRERDGKGTREKVPTNGFCVVNFQLVRIQSLSFLAVWGNGGKSEHPREP